MKANNFDTADAELTGDKVRANAAFIVRACNSHAELLEAAKMAKEYWEAMERGESPYFDYYKIETAIKNAEQ